jgi:tetratricopeptide (TPR) repeat protein
MLAAACIETGELAKAEACLAEANVAEAKEPSSRDSTWRASTYGALYFCEGEWERGEKLLTAWSERTRTTGNRGEDWRTATVLARLHRLTGERAQALQFLQKALDISVEAGHILYELVTRSTLATMAADAGDSGEALPHLQRCRQIVGAGENWRGIAGSVERAEAVVAAANGEYSAAEAQFEKAIGTFRHYCRPWEEADTLQYWGRALLAAGERERAIEKFDAAIEIYRSRGAGSRFIEYVMADKLRSVEPLIATPLGEHRGSANDSIFHREADYWTVVYEGRTSRLKDAKGLRYVAYLLAHPGEEIRALDLVTRIGGGGDETVEKASAEDLSRSGTVAGDLGHAGEILDAQAKAAYQRRLMELEEELEEAREFRDEERIAKAEDEKEALGRELRGAIGLAGRDRRSASAAERGRIAVTKAIRLSLNKIAENDASLGKLLSTTIKTGTVCAYAPDDRFPVSWRL